MKCEDYRSDFLRDESSNPTAGALKHFGSCQECRTWSETASSRPVDAKQTLKDIDAMLKRLPVPRPGSPIAQRVLAVLAKTQPAPASAAPARRRVLPAVAASLAVGLGAWLFLGQRSSTVNAQLPPDPMLDIIVQCNVALATDTRATPIIRLNKLSELANLMRTHMDDIARIDTRGENLEVMARLHGELIRKGVLPTAAEIDRSERPRELNRLLLQFESTGQEAETRVNELPAGAIAPYRTLARTSRAAAERIRALLVEAAS
jgi:hypothetical protein